MTDYLAEAEKLFEYSQALRRDFHKHPELGFREVRTAGIVARELNALGLEVSTGIAETGVVALLEGAKPGPVVLMRFDMDALPIHEQTGAAYASVNDGVMHACGHDAHTAIGLTVARLLHKHRAELAGTAKFVFQPAEEGLGGAKRMVDEGVLANPRPDLSLALHVWNDKPFGWVGVTDGPAMSASEVFQIKISGKGAHGAAPHTGKDPVLAAAQIITALQSIVSRSVAPLDSAVVSVTKIHAGEAFNVIPPEVNFGGTIRTYKPETREFVLRRVVEIAEGIARALDCTAGVSFRGITPVVANHPEITARVQQVVNRLLPGTLDRSERTMGSEDMAFMMDDVPGCYFFVGSANAELGLDAPHHNPYFDIDERTLPRAAGLMASAAAEFLVQA
jgi:amidohydrolase